MFRTCILTIVLLLSVSGPAAAQGAQTLKQQQQREAAEKQVEMYWQEANQKLNTMNVSTSGLNDDTRRDLGRLNDELKAAQEMTSRKVAQMKAAGSQDWERFKVESYAAIDNLNRICGRIQSLNRETRR